MSGALGSLVARFRDARVVVVGDLMLDSYLHGAATRLSREAPVPIVALDRRDDVPGGAGNAAVNVQALGARVELVGVVGDDPEGERLRSALATREVGTDGIVAIEGVETLIKHRVVAGGQMLIRFDTGVALALDADAEDRLVAALLDRTRGADAVIVSDYGYGVMTARVIAALADLQARDARVLVVDARDLRQYRRAQVTAVKPNYAEAVRLLGEPELRDSRRRAAQIGQHGERILEVTGARMAAVTLDTDGAVLFERDSPAYRTYARPASHARAAGAGDTFVAAFALALASGASGPEATEIASSAAAVVVAKDGTSTCAAFELEEFLLATARRVDTPERLRRRLASYREQGRRIVFTNGCFDILHRGHITYLNRAKALGDVLVVGVNSDASVRRLKGADRPVNTLDDRAQVLAALSCVDHVVPFEEDTPEGLIRLVRPHVFVKGGDYTRASLPEAELVESLGGAVQILPYVEEHSTTGIIRRMRGEPAPRAEPVDGALPRLVGVMDRDAHGRPAEAGSAGRASRQGRARRARQRSTESGPDAGSRKLGRETDVE